MDICLLRADFFDRTDTVGLAVDYLLLLATTVVHPRRAASGVLCYSPVAAKVVGFDHATAVAGLCELDRRERVIFDDKTYEVLPTDHFLVNPAGRNTNWNRAADAAATRIVSHRVREARRVLEVEGGEKVPALAVPLNLLSAMAGGGKLMLSDAAIALAMYCNPFVSACGAGIVNFELLGVMTGQTTQAAAAGVANAERRGIIIIDAKTNEYRVRRWFDLPGKLAHENQVHEAVAAASEIVSRKLRGTVLKDIACKLGTSPDVLRATFSTKPNTCCALNSTLLNSTLPHLTQPHATPASPKPKIDKGEEDGGGGVVFSNEEKAKASSAMQAGGWSAEEASCALLTVLQFAKDSGAAGRAVEAIAAADANQIRKREAFWQSTVKKANAGLLPPPKASRHFDLDRAAADPKHIVMNSITGVTLRDNNKLNAAWDQGLDVFMQAHREICGRDVPTEVLARAGVLPA